MQCLLINKFQPRRCADTSRYRVREILCIFFAVHWRLLTPEFCERAEEYCAAGKSSYDWHKFAW
jgi:hypothetical protein